MQHAITIGDVLKVMAVVGGITAIGGGLLFAVYLFNPWRSGH